jgi:hypothetical protein
MSVNKALDSILEGKLDEMRTQFSNAISTKAVEKLEERKIEIAQAYFGQMQEEVEELDEIADTPRGKEAVRQAIHRADATVVHSAISPPRSKKGKREAKNAMKTIDRGIAVYKNKGGVLDPYLKRAYSVKE